MLCQDKIIFILNCRNLIVGNMLGKKFTTYDIYRYLLNGKYPTICVSKNLKSNLRTQCIPFTIIDGVLFHKTHGGKSTERGRDAQTFPEYARVIYSEAVQKQIIVMVHEGSSTSLEAESLSAHRGINTGIDLLSRRVWWPGYTKHYKEHVKYCERCQKVSRNNTYTLIRE